VKATSKICVAGATNVDDETISDCVLSCNSNDGSTTHLATSGDTDDVMSSRDDSVSAVAGPDPTCRGDDDVTSGAGGALPPLATGDVDVGRLSGGVRYSPWWTEASVDSYYQRRCQLSYAVYAWRLSACMALMRPRVYTHTNVERSTSSQGVGADSIRDDTLLQNNGYRSSRRFQPYLL